MAGDAENEEQKQREADLSRKYDRRKARQKAFDREYDGVKDILEKEDPTKTDCAMAEASMEEMKQLFDDAEQLNEEIEEEIDAEKYLDEMDVTMARRSQERRCLVRIRRFVEEHKEQSKADSKRDKREPSASSTSKTARLPKLRLPTFDGTFTKWTAFWETMESDVMNGNFSDITKFNYILGQLKGVALDAVTGIHASGDNLKTLTETLKERFGQQRKIVRAHVCSIYDIEPPGHNYAALSQFYNHVMGDIRSLNNLGVNTEECAAFIIPLMERKLPRQFQDKMGTSGQDEDFNLKAFLDTFTKHLNNLGERFSENDKSTPRNKLSDSSNRKHNMSAATLVANGSKPKSCAFCDGDHYPTTCVKGDSDRFDVVKAKRLCFNCLRPHAAKNCSNRRNCNVCNRRHHTSLHNHFAQQYGAATERQRNNGSDSTSSCAIPRANSRQGAGDSASVESDIGLHDREFSADENTRAKSSGSETQSVGDVVTVAESVAENNKIVLLETGQVTLENGGTDTRVGVLIDRGSMLSYIRKGTAAKLGLEAHGKRYLNVNGFGGHVSRRCYDIAFVSVATNEGSKQIEVLVTDEIVKPINQSGWKKCLTHEYIRELPLADNLNSGGHLVVDLLIGCDSAYLFLENRLITGKNGPTVQFSNIGCFLSGPLETRNGSGDATAQAAVIGDNVPCGTMSQDDDDQEIQFLKSYLDSCILTHEEQNEGEYNEQFLTNYLDKMQFKEGHYYAPLPWKDDHPELKPNIDACRSRLQQVTARLKKLGMADQYIRVMQENINKGYVSEVENSEQVWNNSDCHFMPHFPVLKDSVTTPVRIVFDASCGSPSLNDCLYGGPNMTQDLVQLLMSFRRKKYGMTADIARAFLSVRLLESDRKYVRFLWYKNNDMTKEIVPYTCNTVIFGNISSPFTLAITLHKHLTQYNTPVSLDMLAKTYVDNLLSGVDSETEALGYYKEARDMMSSAAFDLRQWATNSERLNEQIQKDGTNVKPGLVSILGLKWDPNRDEISVAERRFDDEKVGLLSKRKVVSEMSSIFDPLGLLGPMVVPAKSFANTLWVESKSWDEPLNDEQKKKWNEIRMSLQRVHEIKFSRWLKIDSDDTLEIIIFCDACPIKAIGCVAYGKQGKQVTLLGSKNKVVSQKNNKLTVPKLELQAMVMGAQYANQLATTYGDSYEAVKFTLLTDSEIALYWLRSEKKLTQIVKNRVQTIRGLTDVNQWYHVATSDNLADILSRGTNCQGLKDSDWVHGPNWLKEDQNTWPIHSLDEKTHDTCIVLAASIEIDNEFRAPDVQQHGISQIIDAERYSSYTKLLKVTALVTQAFRKGVEHKGKITAEHIQAAEKLWVKETQRKRYGEVFTYLEAEQATKKKLPRRPPIVNQLGLFLGENGQIRCGGRVRNAKVAFDRKCPTLLPNTCHLSTLIIRNAHQRVVHYGVGATMSELRNKYWITSMRSAVNRVIKRCVTCKLVSGRPYVTPLAPDLPDFRLNELTAFRATAVDFTAHIYVKTRVKETQKFETQKVYICLFTCCTTRAVELEVVPDLTVGSFLRAFRRFTASFSVPNIVYCDNAKTFKSAETELKRLLNNVSNDTVQNHLASKGITFKYIPVQASWFGGVHERMIGVAKNAIKKTLGRALVTLDELQTLIKEIQQVINNRPLTYVSNNPTELAAITPNHLIYGQNLNLLPHDEADMSDFDVTYGGKVTLEKMAHRRNQLITNFQKRFQDEYLAVLRERHTHEIAKQNAKVDTVRAGDVVLVHDKDKRRLNWKLGKIEQLNKGHDGLTRSALVRTTSGLSNRAIGKLYPLEFHISDANDNAGSETTNDKNPRPRRAAAEMARERIKRLSQE
jgi:hypothetical protein